MARLSSVLSSVFVALTSWTCVNAFPTTIYTLTVIKPGTEYDGLKVNWAGALNLFQAEVASYCPDDVGQAGECPNGTDTVFANSMFPISEVPGGQDLYTFADGFVSITVQHSHTIPPDAYWEYQGWNWTALASSAPCPECPADNPMYNCAAPNGIVGFQLPNTTVGGVMACTNPFFNTTISLYAVTPGFNRTDCVELDGLGTHSYSGVNPPVWAY